MRIIHPLFILHPSFSGFFFGGGECAFPRIYFFCLTSKALPPDHYAKHITSHMIDTHKQFSQIKADLHRQQCDIYNKKGRIISILEGKIVYVVMIRHHVYEA